jgi:hypothetical protein
MSVATTAPVRQKVNKFFTRSMTVNTGSLTLTVEALDESDRPIGNLAVFLNATTATRITYNAAGEPIATVILPLANVAQNAFLAFANAAGNAAARFTALDTFLQTNGVFPT